MNKKEKLLKLLFCFYTTVLYKDLGSKDKCVIFTHY